MNQTTEPDFGRAQGLATTTTGGIVVSPLPQDFDLLGLQFLPMAQLSFAQRTT